MPRWPEVSAIDRFYSKVVAGPNGCHVWTAAHDSAGYAQFKYSGSMHKGHRWIYIQLRGDIPEGLVLDHLCKNRRCVNTDHLEAVTAGENGRRASHVRLTWDLVDAMRKSHAAGESQGAISRRLGVDKTTINKVIKGRSWPVTASNRTDATVIPVYASTPEGIAP